MRPRPRLIPALLVSLALFLALPGLAVVAPAPTAEAATDTYVVKPGLTFNDPTGSKAQHRRIISKVEQVINHAPRGSRIRMAQYLFDLDSTADALVRAYARGVKVQLLIDDYPISPQTRRMRQLLGTNKKAPSYAARCVNSCMSSSTSVMHAKFFLFSQSGVSRHVSMISSANPYTGNTAVSWNNMHTIVGDKKLYNSLDKYFTDMLPDINRPNYYRTTTSGKHKLYFFPRAAAAGTRDVPMLDVLNHVRCTGMAKGYGTRDRKTVVRIAQWGWSNARLDLARRVWALHNQGCDVQIIANKFNTSPKVMQTLLKYSPKHGQLKWYNAAIDTNGNGRRDKYMHHKVIAINGKWFGQSTKVVYTGSANFSGTATLANNEIIMRVKDNATYSAYLNNFRYIRERWTQRVYVAPLVTSSAKAAQADARLEAQLAAAPDTSDPDAVPADPAQGPIPAEPKVGPGFNPAVELAPEDSPLVTGGR